MTGPWGVLIRALTLGMTLLVFASAQEQADPFLPPTGQWIAQPAAVPSPGAVSRLEDLTIDSVRVKGTVNGPGFQFALLEGPGTETYLVSSGSKLRDGWVEQIGERGVIFALSPDNDLRTGQPLHLIPKGLEGLPARREGKHLWENPGPALSSRRHGRK